MHKAAEKKSTEKDNKKAAHKNNTQKQKT